MNHFFKLLSLILIGLIVFLAFLGIYLSTLFQPVSSVASTDNFVIPNGQAISVIASRLQDQGLIKNAYVFRYVVKRDSLESKIQAGTFELSPDMNVTQIAKALTKGTNDVWITVVEGWRKEEIAQMLSRQDLPEFDEEVFLGLASNDEGYLFPDTYLIPKLSTASTVYNLLVNTFDKKVTQGLAKEIADSSYSLEEAITLASIVEREAKGYEQMRMVAGILQNRLDIGMALQVDCTLQYIKGYSKTQDSWWVTPTAADKELNSAYNTYQNVGLPPGPIANPSIDAIKAVLSPKDSNYLFYLHDNSGQIHYALTLDEHNQNVQNYLR